MTWPGHGELDDVDEDSDTYTAGGSAVAWSSGGATFRAASFSDEVSEDTVPVWGTGELEAMGPAVAASLSEEDETALPVWGTGELEAMGPVAESQSLSDEVSEDTVPVWGTGELEALPATDAGVPTSASYISPNAAAMARKLKEQRLLQSEDPDTRAFAQDLQAILAGKKDHPSTTGQTAPAAEPDEDAPPPAESPKAYPSSFSHGVFDAMGPNMSMAKTFDLGSYDLSRQFDVFDRQMDTHDRPSLRKRPKKASVRSQSAEFAEDLAMISGRSPAVSVSRTLDVNSSFDLRFDVPLIPQQTVYPAGQRAAPCW